VPTVTLQGSTYETSRTDLQLQPINPDWIREGAPVARALTVTQSPDSLLTAGLWDCSAGVFTWIFAADEIVHILEGDVIVHDGRTSRLLVPGTVAYFPRGLETVWDVRRYVKKAFVLRSARASLTSRLARAVKSRLASLVRRGQ